MATILLLLALAVIRPQADCKPQFAPLQTGTFSGVSEMPFWRKDEAGAWAGAGWLGWTWERDTLQPVRLIVRDRLKDHEQDADEVTVERVPDVTFAVRCIPNLRPGRIQTTRVLNEVLDPNRPLTIAFGPRKYELRVKSAREDLFDAQVILTDGRRTQVLYSVDGFADDPIFQIIWAGDLDRDGKLDLVVNLSQKYTVRSYRLLLSSKASGTQLVGEAAVFVTGD